ncbi:PTS transporter subunit EIIC [Photobacterium rosenbergii]|uniref:PTS transporter subunit EIIC n=1 Tax=Photobacterium rosenbergii TaxID=294936 RepID=A0ABU3ZNB3_9GAMM|nr:PTS transporter subunit EIIC [Photobacterium rosenbergii]MDV5171603.1 PTS transporter subunit EIIC [Photobacterium rosenbergii]
MDYTNFAKNLLHLIGGMENVQALTHCATRLRFTLNNNQCAKKQEIQELDGVLSVVESGGQFQVIIGNRVSYVHEAIQQLLTGNDTISSNDTSKNNKPSQQETTLLSKVFEIISGSFSPLIGALAGAGMLKALLAVLSMLDLLDASDSTYLILSAAANAVFYFLPVLLGVSAAIKMGANGYIGGAIGAALLEPNFTGLINNSDAHFFGIPVIAIDYASSVFPILIAVTILAVVEKFLKKICPDNVQMFMVPMMSMLIVVPLTIIVFGPFGVYLGHWIADGINLLISHSGILTGAVVGGSMMFLVMFGLHWGIVPITIANIGLGGDPIVAMWASCTFAQMGVATALWFRTKDNKIKAIAGPAAMSGFLAGVTEPIIYGLIMRFRKTIPIVVVSGAIGGAFIGTFQVKMTGFAFHSIPGIPLFQPITPYVIGICIGFGLAFIGTIIVGPEQENTKKLKPATA